MFHISMVTTILVSMLTLSQAWAAPTVEYFEQRLNHSASPETQTFKQRFIIDSSAADGLSSPVLYFICGESNCFDERGADASPFPELIKYQARHFHAHIVALEHRFFGLSQPFAELTTENLKTLSFENALSDLAEFEKYAITTRGLSGKWIAAGGSYPGVLAAYYRLKFPKLVQGAWASSAPVKPQLIVNEFLTFAEKELSPTCRADLKRSIGLVEKAANDPAALAAIELQFNVTTSPPAAKFANFLSTSVPAIVQYHIADAFCSLIAKPDPLPGFALVTNAILKAIGVDANSAFEGPIDTDVKKYETGVGQRQWMYLECSEFGFFVSRSDASDCKELFGITNFKKISEVRREDYRPLLNPTTSNILFTNGSEDPWSLLTISHEAGNDTNPNTKSFTIQGAAHTADFNATPSPNNSASLNAAIDVITEEIANWLK